MIEVFGHPEQIPLWTDAIEGRPVDWAALLGGYRAVVDWPGASFWPELSETFPDAVVLLSVRDPDEWYRSATNTIFGGMELAAQEPGSWMASMKKLLADRFSDRFDDRDAMIGAYERHNAAVRASVPPGRLLEWSPSDGWEPLCRRLGRPVPDEPFPVTNTTAEFRQMIGLPPLS
jgi:hypothetical protein